MTNGSYGSNGGPDYDAIVVGAGFAGLSAGLWLGRYRRRTLILDGGPPRNWATDRLHGYLGYEGRAPFELLSNAGAEARRYPTVEVREGRASTVSRSDDGFSVVTSEEELSARRIILATGVCDQLPDVANIRDHYGTDVFHCPSCDGYEAKGKQVVVLGWSEEIAAFALSLLDWARTVTVLTDGHPFGESEHRSDLAGNGVRIEENRAISLLGEPGRLRGIELESGGELECDQMFFSIHKHVLTEPAQACGCRLTSDGYIETDESGLTSIPDLYAAGDVVGGPQLVQVAAASGARAGIACARAFHGERGTPSSPDPAPEASGS